MMEAGSPRAIFMFRRAKLDTLCDGLPVIVNVVVLWVAPQRLEQPVAVVSNSDLQEGRIRSVNLHTNKSTTMRVVIENVLRNLRDRNSNVIRFRLVIAKFVTSHQQNSVQKLRQHRYTLNPGNL